MTESVKRTIEYLNKRIDSFVYYSSTTCKGIDQT